MDLVVTSALRTTAPSVGDEEAGFCEAVLWSLISYLCVFFELMKYLDKQMMDNMIKKKKKKKKKKTLN